MSAKGLVYGVLGPLEVLATGGPVALGTPKQRAVLALLLMNRNRIVSADSLVSAVWDGDPVPTARASVHTYVSNIRRLLGTGGARPHTVLAAAPPGYRLNVPVGQCDLDGFVAAKAAGIRAAAAADFEDAAGHLAGALDCWRGPALADLRDFVFVEPFATALAEEKILVHLMRAEAETACGRPESVIGELEELALEHPYREPLWAKLITAYYIAERQSDALNAHRRLKTVLAEELGIDPGPTVDALYQQILRQEPLDIKRVAKATAASTLVTDDAGTMPSAARAELWGGDGRRYRLDKTTTRIGRLPDNDVVLDDPDVSRNHAVIIDTGSSFVIADLRSANGVHLHERRLRSTARLSDGDRIRICDHEFTFNAQDDAGRTGAGPAATA
ncbi:BTAD domain-containing putative transcriptional regulator [Mycolicibacterium llatzerense]|uniref:BTAD domain-containing putative transcriptional regulator n=1 Tax=Mycolicibacterium llatzerense TaxID=280871 RepID=UPI0008DCAD34|nr:BTAD domain-containing putative transcriptional regulator [Mycolicibacterium llatzerense]